MSIGAQNGTKRQPHDERVVGSHGAMLTPMRYGTIISVMTGAVTEPTSSCRETSAASAASASAYMVKPTTNQMITQSAVTPRLIELASTRPSAAAVPAPAPTTSTTWISPMTPMPSTLPAMSCHGRTVASSSSTTRDDFSSTTPCATSWPAVMSEMNSRMPATNPATICALSRSGSGSSAVTSGAA